MSTPQSETTSDDAPGERIAPTHWPTAGSLPGHGSGPVDRALTQVGLLADRVGTSVPRLVAGAVGVVAVATLAWVAFVAADPEPPELSIPYATTVPPSDEAAGATTEALDAAPAEIMVHAAGAVRHPGVYVLADGARVSDALTAAGGPLPDADLDRVNLAAPVVDGTRLYVPRTGEEAVPGVVAGEGSGGGASGGSAGEGDPGATIDLNTATADQLETLPGIGPSTAAAIVDHRDSHGPFARVDDLVAVRGIGDAKLAALRDLVHV